MDFDTLLRVQYEHHSLVCLKFVLSSFAVFCSEVCSNLPFEQGHHMAAVLEERCSREVICRDEAIGALKKENETLEAEKARLSEEI